MRLFAVLLALLAVACADSAGPQTTLDLVPDSLHLRVGDGATITASTNPQIGSPVRFSSSDVGVAVVSERGWVQGLNPGTAWIRAEMLPQRVRDSAQVVVVSPLAGMDLLQFSGSAAATSDSLQGRITIAKPTNLTVTVSYAGICALSMILNPVTNAGNWDQGEWWSARPGGCKWPVLELPVPARGELTLTTPLVSVADVLGDSLGAGTYSVAIRIILAHMRATSENSWTSVVDSVFNIPAGMIRMGS
jgi:hypothetical protein